VVGLLLDHTALAPSVPVEVEKKETEEPSV